MNRSSKKRPDLLQGRDEERARLYASLTPTERVRWVERSWRVAAELNARALGLVDRDRVRRARSARVR